VLRVARTIALLAILLLLASFVLGRLGPTEPNRGLPAVSSGPSPSPALAVSTATNPRSLTLTFSEQDLTAAARQSTPMTVSGITVTDPVVTLQPGRLTLTATGRAFFLSGPIVVVATPVIVDGKATAQIESATLAGVALPDSTKQDIADTFARTLAANIPAGARVTTISVATGTLAVVVIPG
jgi:hypothetical protein